MTAVEEDALGCGVATAKVMIASTVISFEYSCMIVVIGLEGFQASFYAFRTQEFLIKGRQNLRYVTSFVLSIMAEADGRQ